MQGNLAHLNFLRIRLLMPVFFSSLFLRCGPVPACCSRYAGYAADLPQAQSLVSERAHFFAHSFVVDEALIQQCRAKAPFSKKPSPVSSCVHVNVECVSYGLITGAPLKKAQRLTAHFIGKRVRPSNHAMKGSRLCGSVIGSIRRHCHPPLALDSPYRCPCACLLRRACCQSRSPPNAPAHGQAY